MGVPATQANLVWTCQGLDQEWPLWWRGPKAAAQPRDLRARRSDHAVHRHQCSGPDPDISPAYADVEIRRVAEKRGLSVRQVDKLVEEHTSSRILGFMGEPFVNMLELDIVLEDLAAKS
ncbi:potassium-transporting ATPase subunit C [Streptomyces sp. NPDC056002]|uniref:potassium-transporting ATPase subunit C n=1 Tax=Streptomyces sp. NPDC056002 TaxID=3345675 RepID=UPI0035E1014A